MVLFWHRSLCVAFIGAEAIGREADQNTLAKIDYLIAFAILDQNTHDALIAIVFWIRSTDYIQQIQRQIWHTKLNRELNNCLHLITWLLFSQQFILERESRKVFQSGKVDEKICSFNPRLVGPSMVVRQGGWI